MTNIIYLFFHSQKLFGNKNFLPQSALIKFFAIQFCSKKPISVLCGNIFFLLCGFDEKNLNMVSFFFCCQISLSWPKKSHRSVFLRHQKGKKGFFKMLLHSHGIFLIFLSPDPNACLHDTLPSWNICPEHDSLVSGQRSPHHLKSIFISIRHLKMYAKQHFILTFFCDAFKLKRDLRCFLIRDNKMPP